MRDLGQIWRENPLSAKRKKKKYLIKLCPPSPSRWSPCAVIHHSLQSCHTLNAPWKSHSLRASGTTFNSDCQCRVLLSCCELSEGKHVMQTGWTLVHWHLGVPSWQCTLTVHWKCTWFDHDLSLPTTPTCQIRLSATFFPSPRWSKSKRVAVLTLFIADLTTKVNRRWCRIC